MPVLAYSSLVGLYQSKTMVRSIGDSANGKAKAVPERPRVRRIGEISRELDPGFPVD